MSGQINNDQVNKDNDKYISISEAEKLTGIPNATLKRYMLNHSEFIQFRKKGRNTD
jgi:Fic family protein